MTKNLTVRLPDQLAADAEALARVENTSINEVLCVSLREAVDRKRNDTQFKYRLEQIIQRDQELLDRLAK
jgi:predicted transcriptional regulator